MVEISSDAQNILSQATPEAVAFATQNAPGERLTSGEARRLLAQFQNSSPYSGQNVVNAVTGSTPEYNYADPFGARTQIEERLGLGAATAEEQAAREALTGFQDTTRAQINALRANRDLSTGLEAGFEAQRTREATAQEQALANQLGLAQSARMALENRVAQEFDIFQQERAKRENVLLQAIQAGAKNVDIGMSLEELTKAYTKAAEKQAEEAAKKAEKAELKATAKSLGISTSGLSKREIARKLEKYYQSERAKEEEKYAIDIALKRRQLERRETAGTGVGDLLKGYDLGNNSDVARLINSDIASGTDWGTIAATLASPDLGIDVNPGSFADKYLRYKFLGEENPLND